MAQNPRICFADSVHNFGIIEEEGGEVTYDFVFTNCGSSPLVLTRVSTDCGCTTPRFTRRAVESGKEGVLSVAYDPMGRPGAFVKNVQVYTNADTKPIKLQITGNVISRGNDKTQGYISSLGGLQLSSDYFRFPAVSSRREQVLRLSLYNPKKETVTVKLHTKSPLFILSDSVVNLQGEQPANILLVTSFGDDVPPAVYVTSMHLSLQRGTQPEETKEIPVEIPIVPTFSQSKNTPIPEVELTTYYDLGEVKDTQIVERSFDVTNQGEGMLELYSIYCPNKAISLSCSRYRATKGEAIRVHYRIDTGILQKDFDENIDLILNDPKAPYRRVRIKLAL